jgi:hypothetical protein
MSAGHNVMFVEAKMTLSLKLEKKEHYLRGEVKGEFALNKSIELIQSIIKSCEEKQICRILIDAREITPIISTVDRIFLGAYLHKEVKKEMKIAIIASIEQTQNGKILEKYVVTRGVNLKVFNHSDEALKWLER